MLHTTKHSPAKKRQTFDSRSQVFILQIEGQDSQVFIPQIEGEKLANETEWLPCPSVSNFFNGHVQHALSHIYCIYVHLFYSSTKALNVVASEYAEVLIWKINSTI